MALRILGRLNTSLHRAAYKHISRTRHKIARFMGAEFVVRPDNYIDRRLWIEGGYESDQLAFVLKRACAAPFDDFFDIGANFGLYTCVLGRAGSVPKIHSFECDRRNLYHLYGHVRMNGLIDRVDIYPFALGSENGDLSFLPAPEDNTGTSRAGQGAISIKVQQRRLDDITAIRGRRLLFKIDVEGHEIEVLRGMINVLAQNECFLQIEILDEEEEVKTFLENAGYRLVYKIGRDFYFENMDGAS